MWRNRYWGNQTVGVIILVGFCIVWWTNSGNFFRPRRRSTKGLRYAKPNMIAQSVFINITIPRSTSAVNETSTELLGIDSHANVPKIYHAKNEMDVIATDNRTEMHAQLRQYLQKAEPFLVPECNYTKVRLREYLLNRPYPSIYLETIHTSWNRFYADISPCHLYQEESQQLHDLLHDLATKPYTKVESFHRGTQIKLILWFGNKKALMKPLRFDLDYESSPNHFYYKDYERANAEIAAFHLDRLLGFRKVVPTVGRVIKLSEMKALSDEGLAATFFQSPANNTCFFGECKLFCDVAHAICGQPDTIFASVQAYLPGTSNVPRSGHPAPFKRTYTNRYHVAQWQKNMNYCDKLKRTEPYSTDPRRLLDIVDAYIFDFLIVNMDRHTFEVIEIFDRPAFAALNDHGRSFGRSYDDYTDNLAPIYQCCLIRPSTLKRLLELDSETVPLSEALKRLLQNDALSPVLAEKHFEALDRRLTIILRMVLKCLQKAHSPNDVIRTFFKVK